jgi:membrane fusion protein (multidrug efflux system)
MLKQAEAAQASSEAAVTAAQKQQAVLEAERRSDQAALEAAEAAARQAEIALARTVVKSPVNGRVTNLSTARGDYAQVGQSLMNLVPDTVWVTANFKETQLSGMRAGQPVTIVVDAYPDHTFHGHVDSIQAGSGTAFSLLPAENATGNWVKVVQRVPVKIVFDRRPDVLLGPGMSATATVKVQ